MIYLSSQKKSFHLLLITLLLMISSIQVHSESHGIDDKTKKASSTENQKSNIKKPLYLQFPESNWYLIKEKESRNTISNLKCDVLVAPLRSSKLDFIERALYSKIIGLHLSEKTNQSVLDPTLTEYALRSDQKIPSNLDILSVAQLCGATKIIIADAFLEQDKKIKISSSVFNKKGIELFNKVIEIAYDDANLPYSRYEKIAKILINGLGFQANEKQSIIGEIPNIPISKEELFNQTNQSLLGAVFNLQLIASLNQGPAYSRNKENLYERALALAGLLPNTNKWKNLAIARSLVHLHRRPAALAIMDKAITPEEMALVEYLNGNLSNMNQYQNSMDSELLQLLFEIERQSLRSAYSEEPDKKSALVYAQKYSFFTYPIYFSLTSNFPWILDSNLYVNSWLDSLFFLEGRNLETRLQSLIEIGKVPEEKDFVKWGNEIITELEKSKSDSWEKKRNHFMVLNEQDVLNLIEHILFTNVLKSIRIEMVQRDLPEKAATKISDYEPFYTDIPQFNIYKGWNLISRAEKLSEPYNITLNKEGHGMLRSAAYWGRYQRMYGPVWSSFGLSLINDNGSYKFDKQHYEDLLFFPPRSDRWLTAIHFDRKISLKDCVNYSISDVQCMLELQGIIEHSEGDKKQNKKLAQKLILENQHRFKGFSRQFEIMSQEVKSTGDFGAYESVLRTAVEEQLSDWYPYHELGVIFLQQGRFQEASDTFLKYPKFSDEGANRIENSGNANTVANYLFWVGAYEEAKPLFEIAANSKTGAASSFSAQYYLALINQDFDTAFEVVRSWIKRYESKYAYRNLIQLHYMFDNVEKAEAIFDLAVGNNNPQPWVGAFIGRSNYSHSELIDWVSVPHRKSARINEHFIPLSLSQRYIFMTNVIDRIPDKNLPNKLYPFGNGPVLRKIDRGVAPIEYEELKQRLLGEGYPERYFNELIELGYLENMSPIPPQNNDPEEMKTFQHNFIKKMEENREKALSEEVISKFVDYKYPIVADKYAAVASVMRYIYLEEYEAAYEASKRINDFSEAKEFIPYLAFVSAKVGKTEKIIEYINRQEQYWDKQEKETVSISRKYRFEFYLINAYIEGIKTNHNAAMEYLKSAAYAQPYMEQRSIFPMYQVVEAAEILYKESNNELYKEFALDLARRNTVIQPMYAWSHAVVANYTDDSVEQFDSLVKAIKLDPDSYRVSKLPKELIKKAKIQVNIKNPFNNKYVEGDEI